MNHSLELITENVCQWYGITESLLRSADRHHPLPEARQMITMLAGMRRDSFVARAINRSVECVRANRTQGYALMRFNKNFRRDYERLSNELLKAEII